MFSNYLHDRFEMSASTVQGARFPSGFSTRIVGEGISPLSVAYAGLCKCCTLVFKNVVFPQTRKEIWNCVNSFVKIPCLGNGKWI